MPTNKYLVIFSIGPVQSFISQARKTHDLYAGSQLLRELVWHSIGKIKGHKGTIIYPYTPENLSEGEKPALTNRILFKLSTEELEIVLTKLKDSVYDKLAEIAKNRRKNDFNDVILSQLKDVIETHWAVIILSENDDFKSKYTEFERKFIAVKRERPFKQSIEEGARKCNIDYTRNALFYKKTEYENDFKDEYLKTKKNLDKNCTIISSNDVNYPLSKINYGEGLSAMSMLKRFYLSNENSYPSTADVAMMHLTSVLSENDEFKKIKSTNEYLGEKWYDVEMLNLLKTKNLDIQKYYAVLIFDGDNMGEKLSSLDEHNQTTLSMNLSTLAAQLSKVVEKNNYGYTIYAGGDDFLGFLNLHTLFKALIEIKTCFEKSMENYNLTMSAGIAIAHHKTPMGEAIHTARKMEELAKSSQNKNALSIAAIKRSGELLTPTLKWEYGKTQLLPILQSIYQSLQSDFSATFIHNTLVLFDMYRDVKMEGDIQNMIMHEIKRQISRSYISTNISNDKSKEIEKLYNNLEDLANLIDDYKVIEFFQILSLLDFMTRKINENNEPT